MYGKESREKNKKRSSNSNSYKNNLFLNYRDIL